MRRIGRALRLLAAAYGISLSGILLLRLVDGNGSLMQRLNILLTLLLLLALLLFLLLLIFRQWRWAACVSPPVAAFVLLYGVQFLPRPVDHSAGVPQLRLLTYNLHAERVHLAPMLDIIRQSRADVVALQEMSWQMANALEAQLAEDYPYRSLYREVNDNPYHGRGLLSRYPLLETEIWPATYPIPFRLQRGVIAFNSQRVNLYNFHAPPSYPIFGQGFNVQPRADQIDALIEWAHRESGAVVLLGDFNINDLDVNYGRLTAVFTDVYREVGWGLGFTGPDWSHPQSQEGLPFIPIHQRMDYLFFNMAFRALDARVWPQSGGSDHRPLFAVLALETTP